MPELPEVETVRRQLAPELEGRVVEAAGSLDSAKFDSAPLAVGARLECLVRRGKYLVASLDDGRELVVHLGMTGALGLFETSTGDPYVRAWWQLDDGRVLELRDVRRFGRVGVVPAGDYASLPTLAALGPEPFSAEFTVDVLYRNLARSRRAVKTQLLSQRPVAGVGNIYADEALWRSRVRPTARRVGPERAGRLHAALLEVLAAGIRNGGTTLRDYRDARGELGANQDHLDCYGRAGLACTRCGDTLRGGVVDGRGTTWCATCQT